MKCVSIIVPIYLVEDYLRQCIESLLIQTYANIEIILVDDGSPDLCGKICDEYARSDGRIKVIHQENGGISSARNAGMRCATGEYVMFVDGDDVVSKYIVENLYYAIKENNCDVAICRCENFCLDNEIHDLVNNERQQKEIWSSKDLLFELMNRFPRWGVVVTVAWAKLFSKRVLDKIEFKENIRKHEDEYFSNEVYLGVERAVLIDETLYFYRQREGSIMNGIERDLFVNRIQIFVDRVEYFIEQKVEYDIIERAACRLLEVLKKDYIFVNNQCVRKEAMSLFRKYYKIYQKKIGNKMQRTKHLLFMCFPDIYRMIINIKQRLIGVLLCRRAK